MAPRDSCSTELMSARSRTKVLGKRTQHNVHIIHERRRLLEFGSVFDFCSSFTHCANTGLDRQLLRRSSYAATNSVRDIATVCSKVSSTGGQTLGDNVHFVGSTTPIRSPFQSFCMSDAYPLFGSLESASLLSVYSTRIAKSATVLAIELTTSKVFDTVNMPDMSVVP